jgi:Hemolysin coregulated protein Hcp (TssD)
MSTIAIMTIDGGDVIPVDKVILNLFRDVSDQSALPTSSIQGGTIQLIMAFETESDNNTFFASWFQEGNKQHDVNIDWNHISGNQEKFLTMKLSQAQCAAYNVAHAFGDDLNPVAENTVLTVLLVCPNITVGQANLVVGS